MTLCTLDVELNSSGLESKALMASSPVSRISRGSHTNIVVH